MKRRRRLWSLILATLFAVVSMAGAVGAAPAAAGVTTYAELVAAINAAADGDTIVIANDINLPSTINLSKSLTLQAAGDEEIVLTTSSGYRHFLITGGEVSFTTDGVALDGGGVAGGIRSDAEHLILNAVVRNCVAQDKPLSGSPYGGGVYVTKQLTIRGGKISGNKATYGGGIGGWTNTSIIIDGGKILENTALQGAGLFLWENSTLTINRGLISENVGTGGYGGGVFIKEGNFLMRDGKIVNNINNFGGGISLQDNSHFTMEGGTIGENNTVVDGGGVYAKNTSSITILNGNILKNTARYGGGIATGTNCEVIIEGCEILENSADNGGGLHLGSDAQFIMMGGNISRNTATGTGGGIRFYNTAINAVVLEGEISYNTADRDGGGIYSADLSLLEIRNNTVVKNNISQQAYQMTDPSDIALHEQQIDPTVTWTAGFEYIYNNNDVSYTKGTPIDTPEPPVEHTVTLTEHWADDAQPDVVTPYTVADGDPLVIPFTLPSGYTASAEVDSDVLVDYTAGTLTIPAVTQDRALRIVYTPEAVEGHTVTIVEHYLDGALPDRSHSYTVADGGMLVADYEVLPNYGVDSSIMRTAAVPGYFVDEYNQTVTVANVDRDLTVTLNFHRTDFEVIVTEHYADGALEDRVRTFTVDRGADFFTNYEILDGYRVVYIESVPLGFLVRYTDQSISYDNVQDDMYITLTFGE